VALAAAIGGTSPVRTLIVVWFLFTCPGMVLARLIQVEGGFEEASLGIGLSLGINIVVSLLLVYLGLWSAGLVFGVAAAGSLAAFVATLGRGRGWPA
jgi:hypothetical protein